MGTDVYLTWDGMTQADQERQITGYRIDEGRVGYLRASIGMTLENAFLRELFPEAYWEPNQSDQRPTYDFRASYPRAVRQGLPYLISTLQPWHEDDHQVENVDPTVRLDQLIEDASDETLAQFRFGVMWLSSLYDFFDLGIEKQEQKRKPYPLISW